MAQNDLAYSHSLRVARQHVRDGNYGRAFAQYIASFRLGLECEGDTKLIFIWILGAFGKELASRNMHEELMVAYRLALDTVPVNEALLLDFSTNLVEIFAFESAAYCLRLALELNPDSVLASKYLEIVHSLVVERWHFSMLNDVQRNTAFQRAIDEAIRCGGHDAVLDIGTGTGILSMFAVRSGATHVSACEQNYTICEVARKCLAANDMLDKVILFNTTSTDLKIPEQLSKRVSLVITETFDAALFGEYVVETLIHAWENLLLPPASNQCDTATVGGTVIPKSATIWACIIEAEHIRHYSRLLPESLKLWNLPRIKTVMATKDNSPYVTERLSRLIGGYRSLTLPVKIMDVDFNDIKTLRSIEKYESEITLTSIADGMLDAIAVWFDLHLSATESISTGPDSSTCWETAVYHADYRDQVQVHSGDVVTIFAKFIKQHLEFTFLSPRQTFEAVNEVDVHDDCIYVKRNEILRLNDTVLQSALKTSLCAAVHQLSSATGDKIHLTLLSNMPLLSVYACNSLENVRRVRVIDEEAEDLVKKIGGHPNSNVDYKLEVNKSELPTDGSGGDTWNILVADVVQSNGLLDSESVKDISTLTALYMRPVRAVIPSQLRCVAVIIESALLTEMQRVVSDDRTLGLKISDEMNAYSVCLHESLDLTTLPHEKLSVATTIYEFDFAANCEESPPSYLLPFAREMPVTITKSGTINAIAFWFEMTLFQDEILSTLNTNGTGSHWHQAAFVLSDETLTATCGQTVNLKTLYDDGCFRLSLVPCVKG